MLQLPTTHSNKHNCPIKHPEEEELEVKLQNSIMGTSSSEKLSPIKNLLSPIIQTTKVCIQHACGMGDWEITYERLSELAVDDPVSCAEYGKKHGLLDQPIWKRLKQFAKTCKRLVRAIKRSRIFQVRASMRYQYGFEVPKDFKDALRIDKENGNTKWQHAIDQALDQIKERKVFQDLGPATWGRGMLQNAPKTHQKIKEHLVFAVRPDGCHKA